MQSIFLELRKTAVVTGFLIVVCCILYPTAVWVLSRLIFPANASGSLIVDRTGTIRGSHWIGQPFASERYFHPRPSAAGSGYDALSSGGSNLGPTSKTLHDAVKDRIASYRKENGLVESATIPADAVTASGSGLDPHISPTNARLQATRVAQARKIPAAEILRLVDEHTVKPDLGFLGNPRVNVLELNLALDRR